MNANVEERGAPEAGRLSVDVVIPVYNEQEVLPLLFERLGQVFAPAARRELGLGTVRLLVVDDGSTDGSAAIARRGAGAALPVRLICFSRNFGHQAAVSAGLAFSDGDVTVVMDSDLQDPPELLPQLIRKSREGYDVVYAQRRRRRENAVKRLGYWLFYRVYHFLSPIDIVLDSGDFCLMNRRVVAEINRLPERLRFVRGLRSWVGFRQTGVPYDRPGRAAGRSKYSLRRLYQLATDGITAISTRPLKVAQTFALLYFVASVPALAALAATFVRGRGGEDRPFLFLLSFMLLSNSIILGYLYILGAYVGRAYQETKGRPTYIVREVLDTEPNHGA